MIEVRANARHFLGMPAAQFLGGYWQKRPLLIRGAFSRFQNPVAPDDLAGLACEELALARIAIHDPGSDAWTLRTGPFAEAEFARLPKTHWTLLVQDVDKWDADVAALLAPFAFLPSWRIDDVMVSYAEEGGSVGAHVDHYDVFLLQGLGRRRWQIDAEARGMFAYRDDAELRLLREFHPTHEWILEPGDMLYLPPGVPHHGVALDRCMTYSVGMRAPSQAELLVDFADTLAETLPEDRRLGDAALAPSRGDGEIDDAALARVVEAMPWLRLAPDEPSLRRWFGTFITRYRSSHAAAPNPRALTDAAFARALERDLRVQRNPWSRCAWLRDGRAARLFVAGDDLACSLRFARLVCSQPEFALSAVAPADRGALRALIDAGHLALQRASRSRRDS